MHKVLSWNLPPIACSAWLRQTATRGAGFSVSQQLLGLTMLLKGRNDYGRAISFPFFTLNYSRVRTSRPLWQGTD